jgi:hypothetical protein
MMNVLEEKRMYSAWAPDFSVYLRYADVRTRVPAPFAEFMVPWLEYPPAAAAAFAAATRLRSVNAASNACADCFSWSAAIWERLGTIRELGVVAVFWALIRETSIVLSPCY